MSRHVASHPAPPPERISSENLERAAEVIKCLGHPMRLRILESLEQGERTVSELQADCDATQATVSQQLGILRSRSVVDGRRQGAFVFYRIVDPRVEAILHCIRACDL